MRARARLSRLAHWNNVAPGPPEFIDGNRATYLHDGRIQLAWMLAAIAQAERRVDLEMYIFEPDVTGQMLLDALIAAAKRGVLVRLLYDSIGSGTAGPDFFQPLADAGGFVTEFNPVAPWRLKTTRIGRIQVWELNARDHRKLLVCDASREWVNASAIEGTSEPPALPASPRAEDDTCVLAITGGRNIADQYLGFSLGDGQWLDCGVIMFGPIGVELARLFDAMWFHAEGPDVAVPTLSSPAMGELTIMPVGSQPGFLNLLQWAMSRIAVSVKEELRVSCAYFVPSARWRRALANVARRTGACAIVVPLASDVPMVDAASRHLWGGLLKAGVAIYRYAESILHEKTLVYDRVVTVIGSSNIDPRSFRLNYELSVIILGESFAAPVIRWHDRALAESARYTLEDWRRRPLRQKLTDWFWSLWRGQL